MILKPKFLTILTQISVPVLLHHWLKFHTVWLHSSSYMSNFIKNHYVHRKFSELHLLFKTDKGSSIKWRHEIWKFILLRVTLFSTKALILSSQNIWPPKAVTSFFDYPTLRKSNYFAKNERKRLKSVIVKKKLTKTIDEKFSFFLSSGLLIDLSKNFYNC